MNTQNTSYISKDKHEEEIKTLKLTFLKLLQIKNKMIINAKLGDSTNFEVTQNRKIHRYLERNN
jgi:hypothetical protein